MYLIADSPTENAIADTIKHRNVKSAPVTNEFVHCLGLTVVPLVSNIYRIMSARYRSNRQKPEAAKKDGRTADEAADRREKFIY